MTGNPLSPDTIAWGVVYKPAVVAPGQLYWQCVVADGPMDIGGNISIFVDLWDEQGLRVVGVPVLFYWDDGDERKLTELKPGEGFAVDLPMFAGGHSYGVRVDDGTPSDDLFGFGLGKWVPHHAFRVTFRRMVAEVIAPPTEPSTITYARTEIEDVMRHLRLANEQLAKGLLP